MPSKKHGQSSGGIHWPPVTFIQRATLLAIKKLIHQILIKQHRKTVILTILDSAEWTLAALDTVVIITQATGTSHRLTRVVTRVDATEVGRTSGTAGRHRYTSNILAVKPLQVDTVNHGLSCTKQ